MEWQMAACPHTKAQFPSATEDSNMELEDVHVGYQVLPTVRAVNGMFSRFMFTVIGDHRGISSD